MALSLRNVLAELNGELGLEMIFKDYILNVPK